MEIFLSVTFYIGTGLVITDHRDLPKLIIGKSFGSVIFRISKQESRLVNIQQTGCYIDWDKEKFW